MDEENNSKEEWDKSRPCNPDSCILLAKGLLGHRDRLCRCHCQLVIHMPFISNTYCSIKTSFLHYSPFTGLQYRSYKHKSWIWKFLHSTVKEGDKFEPTDNKDGIKAIEEI